MTESKAHVNLTWDTSFGSSAAALGPIMEIVATVGVMRNQYILITNQLNWVIA